MWICKNCFYKSKTSNTYVAHDCAEIKRLYNERLEQLKKTQAKTGVRTGCFKCRPKKEGS